MSPIKWTTCECCEDDFPSYAIKPLYSLLENVVHWYCKNCRARIQEELCMEALRDQNEMGMDDYDRD